MSIKRLLQKDSRVRRLNKMLETKVYSMDLDKLQEEILTLHKTRMLRGTSLKQFQRDFQRTINENLLENVRNRSRLVEIHLLCFITTAKLERHIKRLKSYLATQYHSQIKSSTSTVADRNTLLDLVLESALDRVEAIKIITNVLQLVIKDVDEASWSMQRIINVFEIQAHKNVVRV